MRQSSRLSRQMSGAGQTDVARRIEKAERIIAFLRGMYPFKTAENVAADIGAPAETIQKMIERCSTPNAWTYGCLVCAYGPRFLAAALPAPPEWVVEAARDEALRDLRDQQRRIQEQLDALGA